MKTYHSFKDIETFTKFLRTKYQTCTHGSGCLDYVTVGSLVYTMHEYDMDGRYMSWANKKHDTLIECNTRDRYTNFTDAVLYLFPNYGMLRADIHYAQ